MKNRNRFVSLLCIVFLSLSSCSVDEADSSFSVSCGNPVIENENAYTTIVTSGYTIEAVVIQGNCLTVTVMASGCDGSTWDASLIASEDQPQTTPPQRSVKLDLTNNEACLAVVQRNFTFDIGPIRPQGSELWGLNLEGWNQQIIIN